MARNLVVPADLAQVNCISDVVWKDWQVWTAAAMPERKMVPTGPGYSLYALAVQEALCGAAVLMGRESLVRPHLDSGALVAPFASVPLGQAITAWMLPESRQERSVISVAKALGREVTRIGP